MVTEHRFQAADSRGDVTALLDRPQDSSALLVLAHGAGASMSHPFMETMATLLANHAVATLRFNFPYMEQGRRAPDRQPVLVETIRSAVAFAASIAPGLPLLAGGKSMGGRMTSLAHAEEKLANIQGIVFLGFPLHAPGKDSSERGAHLVHVDLPLLFVQGTRDRLARLDLIESAAGALSDATLHIVDQGDHSFKVPKRMGRSYENVLEEIADSVRSWIDVRVLGLHGDGLSQ
jgi:predicted alpha/beta-hydrolase family hydrolase